MPMDICSVSGRLKDPAAWPALGVAAAAVAAARAGGGGGKPAGAATAAEAAPGLTHHQGTAAAAAGQGSAHPPGPGVAPARQLGSPAAPPPPQRPPAALQRPPAPAGSPLPAMAPSHAPARPQQPQPAPPAGPTPGSPLCAPSGWQHAGPRGSGGQPAFFSPQPAQANQGPPLQQGFYSPQLPGGASSAAQQQFQQYQQYQQHLRRQEVLHQLRMSGCDYYTPGPDPGHHGMHGWLPYPGTAQAMGAAPPWQQQQQPWQQQQQQQHAFQGAAGGVCAPKPPPGGPGGVGGSPAAPPAPPQPPARLPPASQQQQQQPGRPLAGANPLSMLLRQRPKHATTAEQIAALPRSASSLFRGGSSTSTSREASGSAADPWGVPHATALTPAQAAGSAAVAVMALASAGAGAEQQQPIPAAVNHLAGSLCHAVQTAVSEAVARAPLQDGLAASAAAAAAADEQQHDSFRGFPASSRHDLLELPTPTLCSQHCSVVHASAKAPATNDAAVIEAAAAKLCALQAYDSWRISSTVAGGSRGSSNGGHDVGGGSSSSSGGTASSRSSAGGGLVRPGVRPLVVQHPQAQGTGAHMDGGACAQRKHTPLTAAKLPPCYTPPAMLGQQRSIDAFAYGFSVAGQDALAALFRSIRADVRGPDAPLA